MMRKALTDREVEIEIERLRNSPLAALGRKEEQIRYKRRQLMYNLRTLERKGQLLVDAGITLEMMNEPGFCLDDEEGGYDYEMPEG